MFSAPSPKLHTLHHTNWFYLPKCHRVIVPQPLYSSACRWEKKPSNCGYSMKIELMAWWGGCFVGLLTAFFFTCGPLISPNWLLPHLDLFLLPVCSSVAFYHIIHYWWYFCSEASEVDGNISRISIMVLKDTFCYPITQKTECAKQKHRNMNKPLVFYYLLVIRLPDNSGRCFSW